MSPKNKFFIDKMPTNFLWVGIINKLFPNPKIIHVTRNPMAVVWSNYKHFFSSKELSFSNSLDDILLYFKAYKSLMDFWKEHLDQAIFEINYEQLTNDPKKETANLLKYCSLDWEDTCLTFYKNDTLIETASRAQVRQPIYRGSSKEWQAYRKFLGPTETKINALLTS